MILGCYSVEEGYIVEGIQGSSFLDPSKPSSRLQYMRIAYDVFKEFSFFANIIIFIITLYLVVVRPNLPTFRNAQTMNTGISTAR